MSTQKEEPRENEKETPRRSLRRWSRIGYLFIYFGVISLVSSVLTNSSILAFIGLGLTLWGGLFLFIKPTKHVQLNVFTSATVSSLVTVERMLRELNYKGQPVYLPPRQLKELHEGIVFVPIEPGVHLPKTNALSGGKMFLNSEGVCLTPPGQGLMDLYEKRMGSEFTGMNLSKLLSKLPELIVEDLDILDDLEINQSGDGLIVAKMKGEVHMNLFSQCESSTKLCATLGCPLCSSLACSLARATDKAVVIEKNEAHLKEKTIETWYRLIEEK